MTTQITTLGFFANGKQVAYETDSLEWTEGLGEFVVRNVVAGGGQTQQIFSIDTKTQTSKLNVSIPTIVENLALVIDLKNKTNTNFFEIIGTVDGVTVSRTFTEASVTNDPMNMVQTEGSIALEIQSNPAF